MKSGVIPSSAVGQLQPYRSYNVCYTNGGIPNAEALDFHVTERGMT